MSSGNAIPSVRRVYRHLLLTARHWPRNGPRNKCGNCWHTEPKECGMGTPCLRAHIFQTVRAQFRAHRDLPAKEAAAALRTAIGELKSVQAMQEPGQVPTGK